MYYGGYRVDCRFHHYSRQHHLYICIPSPMTDALLDTTLLFTPSPLSSSLLSLTQLHIPIIPYMNVPYHCTLLAVSRINKYHPRMWLWMPRQPRMPIISPLALRTSMACKTQKFFHVAFVAASRKRERSQAKPSRAGSYGSLDSVVRLLQYATLRYSHITSTSRLHKSGNIYPVQKPPLCCYTYLFSPLPLPLIRVYVGGR